MEFTEMEVRLIRILQQDLPLVERPFDAIGASVGMSEDEVIEKIRNWQEAGIIRHFGSLLIHRRAGLVANGMIVWNVSEEEVEPVGERLATYPAVSHCYARPAFPGWPYRLYTMAHGVNREAVEAVARELSEAVGISDYRILFSNREFKKSDTRLFYEDVEGNESSEN